ncbi:MAG: molybdopterin adenylyltransferase [Limisphaerales bacterium]|jgi:molybdopterin adenylyltransferase
MNIARITISDRASAGIYEDKSGPEIESALKAIFNEEIAFLCRVIPDQKELIAQTLKEMADTHKCRLIITTGGTGITQRDVTPEATRQVIEKELPGFAELMRLESYKFKKTAILSRAVCGIRGQSLIINLPGNPLAVKQCIEILSEAIVEAVAHLNGEDPHQNLNNNYGKPAIN